MVGPWQEEAEKAALRVEMVLAEKARRRRLDQRSAASEDVSSGIDAFEVALKHLGGGEAGSTNGSSGEDAGIAASGGRTGAAGTARAEGEGAGSEGEGCSQLSTLSCIRARAPSPEVLAPRSGEYLATLQERRREEEAARKEREVRAAWSGPSWRHVAAWQ